MDSVKCGRRSLNGRCSLKGFTLLELIIVIAIIAILAGISTSLINGYQRSARLETDNNRAQTVYTGFQNMLIDCEINQDNSIFDVASLGTGLKYAEVQFTVDSTHAITNGDYDRITDVKVSNNGGALTAPSGDALTKLQKAIAGEFSLSFDGTVYVYINFEEYLVDSACYFENPKRIAANIGELTAYNRSSTAYQCKSFADYDDQRDASRQKDFYVGVYPIQSEYSASTT